MRQRLRVLAFITEEIEAGRPFPKNSAIRDHMGWKNSSSVPDALWALVRDGHLKPSSYSGKVKFHLPQSAPGGSGQSSME